VPFYVEDSSGRILVEPDGAEWDPETLVDEFQPGGLPQQLLQQMVSNTRFVGTRYRERIVPLQKRAYLLGEARDAGGLALRKPEKGGRFLISLKSEEQLVESAKSSAQGFKIGAMVCALLGAGLLLAGLVS
jgi:E3 Ubiquitin ligase